MLPTQAADEEEAADLSADRDTDETTGSPDSMVPSVMDQSTCSDNSYVKCELPSSINRTDSTGEFQRGAPSEFRYKLFELSVLNIQHAIVQRWENCGPFYNF